MKSKILVIVMALVMVFCLLPAIALATDTNEAAIGETEYATFADAVASGAAGDIVLLKDVTIIPSNEVPYINAAGKTIDLNGFDLVGNIHGTVKMSGGSFTTIDPRKLASEQLMPMVGATGDAGFAYTSNDGVFDISLDPSAKALTFISGDVVLGADWRTDTDQIVTIEAEASLEIPEDFTFTVQTGTKVIVESENVTINGTVVAEAMIDNVYYGDLATAFEDAKSGDTVVLVADIVLPGAGLVVNKDVTLDLNGKSISAPNDEVGDGIFHVTAGTLTINGNGIINGVGKTDWAMAIWADGGDVVINGGTYTNVDAGDQNQYDLIYAKNDGTVTINGGTFECQTPSWTLNSHNSNKGTIIVKGGTFKGFDPSKADTDDEGAGVLVNYVASGYKSVANGDGTFSVKDTGVYPYGQAMTTSGLTLHIPVVGDTYQWQSSTSEDGTYTDISTGNALTLSTPVSGTWYRCVVDGEASHAVRVVKASTSGDVDGRIWTASYGYSPDGYYYVSNGTMAYRVNGYVFDVTGLYSKKGTNNQVTNYMLQTSYSCNWTMYSSDEPNGGESFAQLDALRVSFDKDPYAVLFEADLASDQKAFSFGCDTQLGNYSTSDYADDAALIGTVENNLLQQVAMIGAESEAKALKTDPAFVIAPDSTTPASRFWLGRYSSRQPYAYNTNTNAYGCTGESINGTDVVTRVEDEDSGMTMSWLNVPSGGSVKFVFKVGDVASTGAVASASVKLTSKTIIIKNSESTLFYKILDKNGNPVTGITFEDETGNALTPNADGYVQGVGGDIIIDGLKQSTTYKIVTAAMNGHGAPDEANKAVEEVVTPINPGMTVAPDGKETEISYVATGNSLTFSGLNDNYKYFLETADGYVIDAPVSPTNGELTFTDLPAGYKLYLGAVSEDNEYYDPVEYSTTPVVVTYDANGGEGGPTTQTLSGEDQYLTEEEPTLVCHNFLGWAKSSTATSVDYYPDDFPCLPSDTTLYAVWGLGVHSWATDWSSDNTNHWHECTRDGCDAIAGKEEHHYTDGYCECGKAEPVYYIPETPPTVDVPVSNDENTVDVKADVSGKDATIKPLNDKQIEQIVGDENASGDVVVDLSDLGKTIDTAGIPKETLEAIVEAAEDAGNDTEHLVIKLSTAELKLDDTALRAIVDQANGDIIKFNFDDVGLGRLNKEQKEAVKDMDIRKGYEAYITVNGQRVSDFKGGKVEIIVPYAVPAGESVAGFSVWYIDENGNTEKQKSTYDGKNKWFVVTHFSDYVIAYDENDAKIANCPKDDTCPIHAYADTDKVAWYHDGVHYCIATGLMNGIGDNLFAPNGTTTRAMVVTMLWRLADAPLVEVAEGFNDVFENDWYNNAIRWASANGIAQGYGDSIFGPNDVVTREQLFTMLYNYAKYIGYDVSVGEETNILSYEDAFSVSEWAIPAIQWVCGDGLVNGIDGKLMPADTASRAQLAKVFMGFLENLEK